VNDQVLGEVINVFHPVHRNDDHNVGRPVKLFHCPFLVLRWSERLFVIAGIAVLGWCALLLTDSGVSQWEARRSLR
jgi:hypothetical protein